MWETREPSLGHDKIANRSRIVESKAVAVVESARLASARSALK